MSKDELLKHFMELFPVTGHVMGDQELKYNIVMKYASESKEVQKEKLDDLNELLQILIDREVLNKFEFNNTVNYKAKKEIPVSLSGGGGGPAPAPKTSGEQLKALGQLVVALAESSDSETVKQLASAYKSKYL